MEHIPSLKFSLHYIHNMKKLILVLGLILGFISLGVADSATPTWKFIPLLSGYNVFVPTNSAPVAGVVPTVGLGSTNVLYTSYNGQVLFSLTNNYVNGVLNTNGVAPDAFRRIDLASDANGDIVANAALGLYIGNTNWIPIVVTNSFGQYMVTNWILATSQYPNWMNPASTNAYINFPAAATNVLTVNLYRVMTANPQGGGQGANLGPSFMIPETTPGFTFQVNATGITPLAVITNLPIGFLTGARSVYCTMTCTNGAVNNAGLLVNQLGILQPQP